MVNKEDINLFSGKCEQIFAQIKRDIVGQEDVVENTVIAMIAGGNVLLEGVPGIGKTRLVRSLGRVFSLPFSRIQFTPDLMPADVTGTNVMEKDAQGNAVYRFQPGPIFSNIVLADEINRATPKSQSALLEAMQEHTVTVSGEDHRLQEPFFVLATQNPIEQEGTYPLPEAQIDRFMIKEKITYPSAAEELEIMTRTESGTFVGKGTPVLTIDELDKVQDIAEKVYVDEAIRKYITYIISATRTPEKVLKPDLAKYVRIGASPRATINFLRIAKAAALIHGRDYATPDDVKMMRHQVLRHRIGLSYAAIADNVTVEEIIDGIVNAVPAP